MLFIRKITAYTLIAIISILSIICANEIHADQIYPLEAGEVLVEERIINENHTEIFTQLNEDYYLKKLERSNGNWIIESTRTIYPRWTGLETKKTDMVGDKKLAAALDKELMSYGLGEASLPPVVDYSNSVFLPPAGDQRYQNSCVGWATGYYLRTYQQAQDMGWKVKEDGVRIDSHIFSPSFIYNQINNGVDKGSQITSACSLLMNIGAATLADFPYYASDFRTQPSPAVVQSAYPHRVRKWTSLYTYNDSAQDIIDKIRQYLNTGDLVVAGNLIGFEFMYPAQDIYGNSIITREYDTRYKHAFVVLGYDDNFISSDGSGAFKVVSSWGEGWGNNGFSYISYSAFAANALEGFVFTDMINEETLELAVDINDAVTFDVDFDGTGRYDFNIQDENGQLVYEENNLRGQSGSSRIIWNGKDMTGKNTADGHYVLNIIPYKYNTPKPAYKVAFNKLGMVDSASARAYIFEDVIQYVDIPITSKVDGVVNIKVDYNGTVYELISGQTVVAGVSKVFKIQKSDFDFNNINTDEVKLIINIL